MPKEISVTTYETVAAQLIAVAVIPLIYVYSSLSIDRGVNALINIFSQWE